MSIAHDMRLFDTGTKIGNAVSTVHPRGAVKPHEGAPPMLAAIGKDTFVRAQRPSLLVAEHVPIKGGKQCPVTVGKRTKQTYVRRRTSRSQIRRGSNTSLTKVYTPYWLDITTKGNGKVTLDSTQTRVIKFPLHNVDVLIRNANGTISRFPLDVQISWDARNQRMLVNNKVLTSAKVTCRENRCSLDYDQHELAKIVEDQSKALFYMLDNNDRHGRYTRVVDITRKIGIELQRLKRAGISLKRDARGKQYLDLLKRIYSVLSAVERQVLDEQARNIRKWKRGWNTYTPAFQSRIIFVENQLRSLRSQISKLKSSIRSLLYKYWGIGKSRRKSGC